MSRCLRELLWEVKNERRILENPNVKSFLYGTPSLHVLGSLALDPVRGNCRYGKKRKEIPVDNTPLPKRRRNLL